MVPLIVASAQAAYAFAPAVFGLVREVGGVTPMLVLTLVVQGLAVAAFMLGRRRLHHSPVR
ncbi:hypothetical protein [Roseomonas sp. CECT 9278]|uniref:hypothetical protein n=1 Tax=Roseomonas sp. CECT 9278 TaxID=2845823 RepID=UPI001E5A5AFA|nr:hypothetical protein [Roseomonas sp. CECT 9278]CAH0312472.1 hypothetical protein ROS9278_04993 [Roseomonas sp. CECT 9278]